jgi:hypothetical protein
VSTAPRSARTRKLGAAGVSTEAEADAGAVVAADGDEPSHRHPTQGATEATTMMAETLDHDLRDITAGYVCARCRSQRDN